MDRPEEKLMPCPFCGGEVRKINGQLFDMVVFVCPSCGADVCFYDAEHEPEATRAWNRRCGIVSAGIYDVEEIHRGCTVQIWKNSTTGEVSFGWWKEGD